MDPDVASWHWASKLICDGEGYRLVPLVDLKILWDEDQCLLPVLLSMCGVVTRWSRSPVTRLSSDSCLTSSTLSSYRHPLGRVGRWYCVGIFVVLLDGRGQLIDQCDGVFTREAKSCQVRIERGRLSTWSEQSCYNKDLRDQILFISTCTDTGVIATHALSFYRPLAPLSC